MKNFIDDLIQAVLPYTTKEVQDKILDNINKINPEHLRKMQDVGLDIVHIFKDMEGGENPFRKAVDNSPFSYYSIYSAIIMAVIKYGLAQNIKKTFTEDKEMGHLPVIVNVLSDMQRQSSSKDSTDFSQHFTELLRLFFNEQKEDKDTPSIIDLLINKDFQKFLLSKSEENGLPNIVNLTLPDTKAIYAMFQKYKESTPDGYTAEQPINLPPLSDLSIHNVSCNLVTGINHLKRLQERFGVPDDLIEKAQKNSRENGFYAFYKAVGADQECVLVLYSLPTATQDCELKWVSYNNYCGAEQCSVDMCFVANELRNSV